ncbi:MAG: hypothetical protein ACH37Z_09895 [Anaerolineae bacterium]
MNVGFFARLTFGRAAERSDTAIAARAAGLPISRTAQDLGAAATRQAVWVEHLFGPQRAMRPDPDFRRQLEARVLDALQALPVSGAIPLASAVAEPPVSALSRPPTCYRRPLLLGACSLALGTLLLLGPGGFASDMAAAPTALAATALPEDGPTVTFTPEARATDDARHARRLLRLTSAGG